MTNSSQNSQPFTEETSLSQPRLKVIKLSRGITENFKDALKTVSYTHLTLPTILRV